MDFVNWDDEIPTQYSWENAQNGNQTTNLMMMMMMMMENDGNLHMKCGSSVDKLWYVQGAPWPQPGIIRPKEQAPAAAQGLPLRVLRRLFRVVQDIQRLQMVFPWFFHGFFHSVSVFPLFFHGCFEDS